MGFLVVLMPIVASVGSPLANILEYNEQSEHIDIDRNINHVMLVFISQTPALKSSTLESKVVCTICSR